VPAGKSSIAENAFQTALELDPLSRIINTNAAEQFIFTGQYDVALDRIGQTLALAPDFAYAWQTKGLIHLARNEFVEARAAFREISEITGSKGFELKTVDIVEAYVRTGKPVLPPAWFNDLILADPYYASFSMVCAGHYESALDLIEQRSAGNIPHTGAFFLKSDLFQKKMGHIPRYQELVTRLTAVEPD
jgi:predicted Zn-dependent protease